MSYNLTNISGSQIVCDLAVKGKTLRLNNKQTETIKENEITPHIRNLMNKGLILIKEVHTSEPKAIKKTTKKVEKEKEE